MNGLSVFYIQNETTGLFARDDSEGEHDGRVTDDFANAKRFRTYGEAAEFSQNFGPEFSVTDSLRAI